MRTSACAAWLTALVLLAAAAPGRAACSSDELVVYGVYVDTHWSRELFPKQYPEWRPPAGWSKLVGRSHDASYRLFREGEHASAGFQAFAEKGQSDGLEAAEHAGVYDEFTAPAVARGAGRTMADFFLDGNHSLVSVAARVVPSPDWFIGVDSLDLCRGSHWIDSIAIEVDPMDAGTDNGFTFTAPNWPSEPKEPVARITSNTPSHPANSFYYPKLDKLPSIATLTFVKCQSAAQASPSTVAAGAAVTTQQSAAAAAPSTAPPSAPASATPTALQEATSEPAEAMSTPTATPPPADTDTTDTADTAASDATTQATQGRPRRAAGEGEGPASTAASAEAATTTTTAMAPPPEAAAGVVVGTRVGPRSSARAHAHTCPEHRHLPDRLAPTFAQTEIDDIDALLEERVYHLSTELPRSNTSRDRPGDRDPLDGNEISNDLGPGTTMGLDSTESAVILRRTSKARRSRKGSRQAKHCQVSDWSPWSPCSVSCGVGDATRSRRVLEQPRRGGRPCPPLQERRWCGGHSECPQNFFNW